MAESQEACESARSDHSPRKSPDWRTRVTKQMGLDSNVAVVVMALTDLGGASRSVHTEDIAWKAFELAPQSFSWCLQPYREKELPDKEVARIALADAEKAKNGHLVVGAYNRDTSKDGWRLTPSGVTWITENRSAIAAKLGAVQTQIPKIEAQRFAKRFRNDPAFKHFSATGTVADITSYAFTDLLNCSPDASYSVIKVKFDRLVNMALLVGDPDIVRFLELCKLRFGKLLGEGGGE